MTTMTQIDLFVIDGQNDFCARGAEAEGRRGALYVEGADTEARAVAAMIERLSDPATANGFQIRRIHATLDTHHRNDASHHIAWTGTDGRSPPPFTVVTHEDVLQGRWVPRFSEGVWEGRPIPSRDWAELYTRTLEQRGRAPLCLWPVHCQIGTWGSAIFAPLHAAYDTWCDRTQGWIDFLPKGQWPWSEHYSGLQAEVPDPTRPETEFNRRVVEEAMEADSIAWVGWAGSHCLRWTALDAANHYGLGVNKLLRKSVFFEDASAPVPDIPGASFRFSDWRREFLEEVASRGARISTTTRFPAC